MEKILVALNPGRINTNVIDFACYVAGLTRSSLTGIFFENREREPVPIARAWREKLTEVADEPAILEKRSAIKLHEDNILLFEEACRRRGVRTTIHFDTEDLIAAINTETRFADLLIVDPELLFEDTSIPGFMQEVLAKSECPVVMAPYVFTDVDEILYVYDGSASSTLAIKQFAYLFPKLTDLRITVVQTGDKANIAVAEKKKLGEFLQMHFSGIGFRVLEGNTEREWLAYLQGRKNIFVIMGAEATWLKKVNLPLFFGTGSWYQDRVNGI
jgi:hypothetical protein